MLSGCLEVLQSAVIVLLTLVRSRNAILVAPKPEFPKVVPPN